MQVHAHVGAAAVPYVRGVRAAARGARRARAAGPRAHAARRAVARAALPRAHARVTSGENYTGGNQSTLFVITQNH